MVEMEMNYKKDARDIAYDASVALEKGKKAIDVLTEDYFGENFDANVNALYAYAHGAKLDDNVKDDAERAARYFYDKDRIARLASVAFDYICEVDELLNKIVEGGADNE